MSYRIMRSMLASLAFADAKHDFSASLAGYYFHTLQASIPGTIQLLPRDSEIIDYILTHTGKTMQSLDIGTANRVFRHLGGTQTRPVAIICDAAFCKKLMNIVKMNTIGEVYAINNRERMNDPGTNKHYTNDERLYSAEEILTNSINYSAYSEISAESHLHTSRFNIEMSPIEIIINGGTENIRIKYKYQENKKGLIKQRLEQIKTSTSILDDAAQAEVQISLLQKRCGDWLQVLSCLDKTRLYMINGIPKNLKDAVVYFCSEDQVAIAYSVFLGINCIQEMSDKSYRIYQGGNNELPLEIYKFRLHRDISLPNSQEHIRISLSNYDRLYAILEPALQKIETASSMIEIKECMKYAIHFNDLLSCTTTIKYKRHMLELFLINPYDDIFNDEQNQRTINSILQQSNSHFTLLDIYAPISEEKFALFDPSKFTYKQSSNSAALYILYGQAILSQIASMKELHPFVAKCIEKICEYSDDENVAILYMLFAEKYLHLESSTMVGGGENHLYSRANLEKIGTILIQSLRSKDFNSSYSYFHITKTNMFSLGIITIGEYIIDHIIMKYNIKLMDYLTYIKEQEYPEDKWEIYKFLKIQKAMPILPYRKRMTSKTRRDCKKSRKNKRNT